MKSWAAACALLAACCVHGPPRSAAAPAAKPHGKDFSSSRHSRPSAPQPSLPESYQRAVQNAEHATARDISRQLTPIRRDNGALVWRGSGETLQLLVATWTTHRSYFPAPGTTFRERYPVWVTAAPELARFCAQHDAEQTGTPLPRRLEQLLGLPPDSGHQFVVELWVNPADLFRPTADPEITDGEAELAFPEVRGYLSVSADYRAWYERTAAARYRPPRGPAYPWTRLGYTYDWGNPRSRVGLSEFVIRPGSTLTVRSVTATKAYGSSDAQAR